MKKIQFLGASGMVTGSGYLLRDNSGNSILVDMGMFQGKLEEEEHNTDPLAFDPRTLNSVILTHAHLDHCGRLPILMRKGFKGRIFMTPATRQLVEVTLMDSAKIAAANSRLTREPVMYDESDVFRLLKLGVTVEYDQPFEISRYSTVFKDAGHILGSASIVLTDKNSDDGIQKIAFSGDLGNTPQDLVRPTEYIEEAEAVVMESTYGDRDHPIESPQEILLGEIDKITKNGGTLLIPAFSIERTQALLHMIGHMKEEVQVTSGLPVFLDSPMGNKITDIYREFPQLYSEELSAHALHGDPFDFTGLTIIENPKGSRKMREYNGPKIIIAGSGMMSGGRIVEHARYFLPKKNTRLLFVGFQAEETLGREILDGAREVWIYGANVHIRASVNETKSMSAHADQSRLVKWLQHIQGAKKVFLTHGEDGPRKALTVNIQNELNIPAVSMPKIYEEVKLSDS